jgi:hypothetical protein
MRLYKSTYNVTVQTMAVTYTKTFKAKLKFLLGERGILIYFGLFAICARFRLDGTF